MDKPPNYFEGFLQLRGCSEKVINFVIEQSQKQPDGTIAKVKKVSGGGDFYMQSNKWLRKLGKLLENNFSGTVKISRKLFTRDKQTSKNVYRLTVLFRESEFRKGDRILVQGEEYEIIGIAKKLICKGEKKKQFTFEELRKLKAQKI